ncbi:hypothetical protein DPMN_037202, partial [Dreissena polymorpha]
KGKHNTSMLTQKGKHNTSMLTQKGKHNTSMLTQKGKHNTSMLTQTGSKDFVVYTERSIHPWGVPQTQITPTIVNKVLKVNMSVRPSTRNLKKAELKLAS